MRGVVVLFLVLMFSLPTVIAPMDATLGWHPWGQLAIDSGGITPVTDMLILNPTLNQVEIGLPGNPYTLNASADVSSGSGIFIADGATYGRFEAPQGYIQLVPTDSNGVTIYNSIHDSYARIRVTDGGDRLEFAMDGTVLGNSLNLFDSGAAAVGDTTLGAGLKLDVNGNVGATQYCDGDGGDCFTAGGVAGLLGGGGAGAGNQLWNGTSTTTILNDSDHSVGIGDDTPDGTLKLDVEGQIGATEYCDENGQNCFSAGGGGAGGAALECPTDFTAVMQGGRFLGCLQNDEQGTAFCQAAINDCAATFGGKLATYGQIYNAFSQYDFGPDESDDVEWTDGGMWDFGSTNGNGKCSTITNALAPSHHTYNTFSNAYRCWIDAGTLAAGAISSGNDDDVSCPPGFTMLENGDFRLGCIRNSNEGPTDCLTAVTSCHATYGGRLPSFNELYIATTQFGGDLSDELTENEWMDVGYFDGTSRSCGYLQTDATPRGTGYSLSAAYRCFLPFSNGASDSGSTSSSYHCPAGFVEMSSQGNTMGCIALDRESQNTCEGAIDHCWDNYGGRLPSYSEMTIALENYELNNEGTNPEWLDGSVEDSTAAARECSAITSSKTPYSALHSNNMHYRCFIPASGGNSSSTTTTTTSTNSSGSPFTCPAAFTKVESKGNTLGCMQDDHANSGSDETWQTASAHCFDVYGGRLPTATEWYVTMTEYDFGPDETNDYEWTADVTSNYHTPAAAVIGWPGLIDVSYSLMNVDRQFRCFIPAGANGGGESDWETVSLSGSDDFDNQCQYRWLFAGSPSAYNYAWNVNADYLLFPGNSEALHMIEKTDKTQAILVEEDDPLDGDSNRCSVITCGSNTVSALEKNCFGSSPVEVPVSNEVYAHSSADVTITNWGGNVDTGLAVTITPSSTSSEIFVEAEVPYEILWSGTSHHQTYFTLWRGDVGTGTRIQRVRVYHAQGSGNLVGTQSLTAIDTPSTTSATKYSLGIEQYSTQTRVFRTDSAENSGTLFAKELGAMAAQEGTSCPSGFTKLTGNGRALGCIQDATQGPTEFKTAALDCFTSHGGRLPTYTEMHARILQVGDLGASGQDYFLDTPHSYNSGATNFYYASTIRGSGTAAPGGVNAHINTVPIGNGGDPLGTDAYYLCFIPAASAGTATTHWNATGDVIHNTNTGNVGIGTSSPGTTLEIEADDARLTVDSTGANDAVIFVDSGSGDRDPYLVLSKENSPLWAVTADYTGSTNNDFEIFDYQGTPGTRFIIEDTSGDVGIGDTTPDGTLKLDVEGQIGATEYCDENGGNCVAAGSLGGGGGSSKWTDAGAYTHLTETGDDVRVGSSGTASARVHATGTGTGVRGDGGTIGISGYGSSYGVFGRDTDTTAQGMLGYENSGVYGDGNGNSYALRGVDAVYGVHAVGTSYGGYFDGGSNNGAYGRGQAYGVRGTDTSSGGGTGYLGYGAYGVYSTNDVRGGRLCIGTDCRSSWPSWTETPSHSILTRTVVGGGPCGGDEDFDIRVCHGGSDCSGWTTIATVVDNSCSP